MPLLPTFSSTRITLGLVVSFGLATIAVGEDFQGAGHSLPYEDAPIRYAESELTDPVAKLQKKIDSGEVELKWDEQFGYLPSVLDELHVPRSTQALVFSKTSLQRTRISPENPRALYYNDDVYIGYIPGSPLMEVSAVDPKLGGTFYSLEQEKVRKPKFTRETDCLRCHGSARSLGVPGHILRSIGTDDTGELDPKTEAADVDQCMPMAERWAGYYITGHHGSQLHRGNLIGPAAFARQAKEPNYLGNITDLSPFFDVSRYPAKGSDLCALMVLEHQTHMHNYITRLNFETQIMMQTYGHIRYLRHQVNGFLRYMLFTEEAPLTEPVVGDSTFVSDFSNQGSRDGQGRSLRDLDMRTRMFKYPCSYLIYSEAFDALPEVMRDHLLQRLFDILTDKDPDPQFARIAETDKQAILEILRATKPNLPAYWQAPKTAAAEAAPVVPAVSTAPAVSTPPAAPVL